MNYGERADDGSYLVYPLRVREMETIGTVTVTGGAGSLPADFLEPIAVTNPSGVTNAIDYATGEWIANAYPTGQNATDPHFYTIVGVDALQHDRRHAAVLCQDPEPGGGPDQLAPDKSAKCVPVRLSPAILDLG